MCGVVAVSLRPGVQHLDASRAAATVVEHLLHRGPDGWGVVGDARSAVAMCRLRVRGSDCLAVPFPGGGGSLSYNGEVYSARGEDGSRYVPADGLHEALAVHLRQPLEGMYALAFRAEDGSIHVSRDPLGIKPLFIRETSSGVAVASEIRALRSAFGVAPIRPAAVAQHLLLGRVVDGGTFFEGIRPVAPGTLHVLSSGTTTVISRRTTVTPAVSTPRAEMLRSSLLNAVEAALVSERPIGLAVSGGLDSTLIAYALDVLGCRDVTTVSVCPSGTGDGVRSLDELHLPGQHWPGWRHHTVRFGMRDMFARLPHAVAALGEPTSMSSSPMYLALADAARAAGIVVMLVGEGVDEMFLGYRSYLRIPQLPTAADFYLRGRRRELVTRLIGRDRANDALDKFRAALSRVGGHTVAETVGRFEREHSLQPLLHRTDHLLMARGIEGRTPYLHGDLPAIASSIPVESLLVDGQTKVALRQAFDVQLPHFRTEVKRAFRAPVRWWSTAGAPEMRTQLCGLKEPLRQLGLSPAGLEEILRDMEAGGADAADLAYAVLTLGLWAAWLAAEVQAGPGEI